eukprot:TRINITY_DN22636_c0_g1_i1.p1 TRINITY_DN22636_c0_g1~~TRINITY_DN22636_c0_g1_i1.p1  ORF type:complete len:549 (+),score=41.53 TRINITY_DN22636_c0_g1_i1:37-1647(+)
MTGLRIKSALLFGLIWLVTHLFLSRRTEDSPIAEVDNGVYDDLITFKACNGFANQRISILYAVLIAMTLDKTLVLPRLPLDGTQEEDAVFVDGTNGNSERFSLVYDLDQFKAGLQSLDIQVWEIDEVPGAQFYDAKCDGLDLNACTQKLLDETQNSKLPIVFGCTFPTDLITKTFLLQNERQVKLILKHLNPATKYAHLIEDLISKIKTRGKDGKFNLVHARAERDWVDHCKTWEHIPDGVVRDNCMNNTESIGQQLSLKKVDSGIPLYVAIQSSQAEPRLLQRIIQNIKFYGYRHTLLKEDIAQDQAMWNLPREIGALVDFYVAMQAEKFIGNSVSSFSALILLERQFQDKWSSYYNSGNIPMSVFLPFYKIPWVFYSKCEDPEKVERFVFMGLQSARLFGKLQVFLYCIGKIDSKIQELIEANNIALFPRQRVGRYIEDQDKLEDISLLGGLVMLEELLPYNYVVFSGPKIYVRKQVTLDDFFSPLPDKIASYHLQDQTFTGIILVNTNFIQKIRSGWSEFDVRSCERKKTGAS